MSHEVQSWQDVAGRQENAGRHVPGCICRGLFSAARLSIWRSSSLDKNRDTTFVVCPDPKSHVVYELKRIRKK